MYGYGKYDAEMKSKKVFCDTSFFIRLDVNDPLYDNTIAYFKYFIYNDFELIISTIAIAEYCTCGNINELPFDILKILPFDLEHAKRTGEFAKIAYQSKKTNELAVSKRIIIQNDTKLFAQADCEKVSYYISADTESLKIHNLLKLDFQFIDLRTPYYQQFRLN